MDAKKFNEFETQIDFYLSEIRYFNDFYEEMKKKDPMTNNRFYNETMGHGKGALEIYNRLINDRDLLEGHRNILEREKTGLDKKMSELESLRKRKREPVGV